MPVRVEVAYVLIAIMAAIAVYLLTKWRNHAIAERRRLSGKAARR